MTKREQIGAVVIVLLLLLVGWMWHDAQMTALKTDLTNQLLKQQRTEVKQETQQKVEEVKQERKAQVTPEQQVQYASEHIRIPLSIKPQQGDDHPPEITFPAAAMPKLADYVAVHDVTLAERDGFQKQLKLCDEQVKALEQRKGGFWTRAKWFVIGTAAGAGVIAATRR